MRERIYIRDDSQTVTWFMAERDSQARVERSMREHLAAGERAAQDSRISRDASRPFVDAQACPRDNERSRHQAHVRAPVRGAPIPVMVSEDYDEELDPAHYHGDQFDNPAETYDSRDKSPNSHWHHVRAREERHASRY
jgi:hypothetical protein